MKHYSVMLNECIDMLEIKPDGIYIDGTLGRGGHSKEILKRLDKGLLYVFDLDETAIREAKERLKDYQNVVYIHDNFANMKNYVNPNSVDGILLDLGVSSPQFDDETRGFSYRFDSRLDMRMNQEARVSAYEVVNNYSYEELLRVIRDYGEEPFASKIASNIVKKREIKSVETTFELVDIIKSSMSAKYLSKKGHPAKQTFQALRIEVNHELDSLKEFLYGFDEILKKDGIVAIITFHSLEDKLVKARFNELSKIKVDKRIAYLPDQIEKAPYELINHKVIIAGDEELNENTRSKSAKLRGIRKIRG